MHKALSNLPVLDTAGLRQKTGAWASLLAAGPGLNRVVVEWSVSKGPNCFVYPAGDRAQGFDATSGVVSTQSDERYADFLEFDFVPQVVATLRSENVPVQVNCVDLRPIQTQRARRRVLEAAAKVKTGDSHAGETLAGQQARAEPHRG
ncbi:MAG: hypothetical protein H7Z41_06815 [Cytophagales bacterium]|nr:hypothetical protein [Armatimonadota bacterium]